MKYDIVLVLYNSAYWLPKCIASLANVNYDIASLNVIAVDNSSNDDSAKLFETLVNEHTFGNAILIRNKKNAGFGSACNLGAANGSSPFIFFLNVDTEVDKNLFVELDKGIQNHPNAGGFECRQLPYEMGHHVNPVTLETPWASGACLVVPRDIFYEAGEFDSHLFMYCEDVDLSWRIRATANKIFYLPKAVVNHYVLNRENPGESEFREYSNSFYAKLLLAYKYGSFSTIIAENRRFLRELRHPRHFDNVRKIFLKNYMRHFIKLWQFLFWRFAKPNLFTNSPSCFYEDFAPERGREILNISLNSKKPKISVIVRTHKRPDVLRGALISINNQTYSNYEIIVVEDGEPCSKTMIEKEFSHLPLKYFSTGKNIGRGAAGNFGLTQASGNYFNFLDDDDYFYPDHLELMANAAASNPEADLILGCAMVMKIDVTSQSPYEYIQRELYPMRFERVDIFTMCQTCQIPIQSAIFKRSLFESEGGLREDIHGHEDWAMWMRYLAVAKRIDPKHIDIHRATSIFVLPSSEKENKERLEKYRIYDDIFFNDQNVKFSLTMADMRGFYDDIIADTLHLNNTDKLEEYMAEQIKTRQHLHINDKNP